MSCNCKTTEAGQIGPLEKSKTHPIHSFLMTGAKFIGFVISLLTLPIINIVLIKMMFQAIVLSKNIDMKQVFEYYFKKKQEIEDLDDEDSEDDEYEMLNVEEISKND